MHTNWIICLRSTRKVGGRAGGERERVGLLYDVKNGPTTQLSRVVEHLGKPYRICHKVGALKHGMWSSDRCNGGDGARLDFSAQHEGITRADGPHKN